MSRCFSALQAVAILSCFELALHGACHMGHLLLCQTQNRAINSSGRGEWMLNLAGSGLGIIRLSLGKYMLFLTKSSGFSKIGSGGPAFRAWGRKIAGG